MYNGYPTTKTQTTTAKHNIWTLQEAEVVYNFVESLMTT